MINTRIATNLLSASFLLLISASEAAAENYEPDPSLPPAPPSSRREIPVPPPPRTPVYPNKPAIGNKQEQTPEKKPVPKKKHVVRHAAAAEAGSIAQEAALLKEETAKLDTGLHQFELHSTVYEDGALHKSVHGHAAVGASQHIKNVAKLQEEYSQHVAHYRALVEDYRKFYDAYVEHWQRYQKLLADFQPDNEKAQLGLVRAKFNLSAIQNGPEVLKAEDELSDVLKRMFELQQESPHLSESYLCPAYDDLKNEFVQAEKVLTYSISVIPVDVRSNVAKVEVENLLMLQTQMKDADALHTEQLELQSDFTKLLANTKQLHDEEKKLEVDLPEPNALPKSP